MNATNLPVRQTRCATCPFTAGSPYAHLASQLAQSALEEASRICHSTGSNGLMGRTGLPSFICRGARDVQLQTMAALGVIAAPTDQAWNDARELQGMKPQEVRNPVGKQRKRKQPARVTAAAKGG